MHPGRFIKRVARPQGAPLTLRRAEFRKAATFKVRRSDALKNV
jgi:hypothetical protein